MHRTVIQEGPVDYKRWLCNNQVGRPTPCFKNFWSLCRHAHKGEAVEQADSSFFLHVRIGAPQPAQRRHDRLRLQVSQAVPREAVRRRHPAGAADSRGRQRCRRRRRRGRVCKRARRPRQPLGRPRLHADTCRIEEGKSIRRHKRNLI